MLHVLADFDGEEPLDAVANMAAALSALPEGLRVEGLYFNSCFRNTEAQRAAMMRLPTVRELVARTTRVVRIAVANEMDFMGEDLYRAARDCILDARCGPDAPPRLRYLWLEDPTDDNGAIEQCEAAVYADLAVAAREVSLDPA